MTLVLRRLALLLLVIAVALLPFLVQAASSKKTPRQFGEAEDLAEGLGPRFNLDSCGGCHAHPSIGGSSPATNPQIAVATAFGALNTIPPFLDKHGPIREVRFKSDSQVHELFVISGRVDPSGDARGCTIRQEDFSDTANIIFRIPTPVFGAGLVEQIPDSVILDNQLATMDATAARGITGQASMVGTRVGRFGWKAQHFDLEQFAGEAYNVEQGVTNELSPTERDTTPACQLAPVPNNLPPADGGPSDVESFATFMRALPPPPARTIRDRGTQVFADVGCALCHASNVGGVPAFTDWLVHDMGDGLADGVTQGTVGPREFRTAPLWGVGKRLFLLHDGRATRLEDAIAAHASPGSEANQVIDAFQGLSAADRQALLQMLKEL